MVLMGKDEAKQHLAEAIAHLEKARGQFGCGWCEERNDASITLITNLRDFTDTAVLFNKEIESRALNLKKDKIQLEYAEYERLVAAANGAGAQTPTLSRPRLLGAQAPAAPAVAEKPAGVMTRLRESRGPIRSTIISIRESIPRPKDLFEV